jgi:hypothetical protein
MMVFTRVARDKARAYREEKARVEYCNRGWCAVQLPVALLESLSIEFEVRDSQVWAPIWVWLAWTNPRSLPWTPAQLDAIRRHLEQLRGDRRRQLVELAETELMDAMEPAYYDAAAHYADIVSGRRKRRHAEASS